MAKAFDAAGKGLLNRDPKAWLALGGLPAPAGPEAIQPGNVDLSGYTAAADWLGRVAGPEPYTAHLELQSSPDPDLDTRVLLYHVLGGRKYGWPVASVVFLLRPLAQSGVTGRVLKQFAPDCRLDFQYRVVRVWELAVEQLLSGGVGSLPLAPVAAVADPVRDLPGIYRRVWERLEKEAPADADDLWGMTYVMSGLRHPPPLIDAMMRGVHNMKDSATYQAILAEGEAKGEAKGELKGEREMLIRVARAKLGEPDAAARAALESITNVARLAALGERFWQASSWAELLAITE